MEERDEYGTNLKGETLVGRLFLVCGNVTQRSYQLGF